MDLTSVLAQVVGGLPVGVMVVDGEPPHAVVYQNAAFLEIHGLDATEDRTLESLYVAYTLGDLDGQPLLLETLPLRTCVQTRQEQPWRQLSLRTSGGELKYIAVCARHVETETPSGLFLLTVEDCTEAVRASKRLTSSDHIFRTIFGQLPLGLLLARADGRGLGVNPCYRELLDMEDGDPENLERADLLGPHLRDNPVLQRAMVELMEGKPFRHEERILKGTDRERCLGLTGYPIPDETGRILRLFVLVEDVEDQRRLERRHRQAQSMEAASRLAAGLAHDVNNTVTAVAGYAEMLLASETDPRKVRFLGQISAGASQVTSLIDTLAGLGKAPEACADETDLAELVRRQVERLNRQELGAVSVTCELGPGELRVRGRSSRLEDSLSRLTRNAIESMPTGGQLVIALHSASPTPALRERFPVLPDSPCAFLAVRDTGAGITEERLHRIFEPYVTTKGPGASKGTGLGLAIVYALVKDLGGGIDVTSIPDRGTTITLVLPLGFELHSPPPPGAGSA